MYSTVLSCPSAQIFAQSLSRPTSVASHRNLALSWYVRHGVSMNHHAIPSRGDVLLCLSSAPHGMAIDGITWPDPCPRWPVGCPRDRSRSLLLLFHTAMARDSSPPFMLEPLASTHALVFQLHLHIPPRALRLVRMSPATSLLHPRSARVQAGLPAWEGGGDWVLHRVVSATN
jgi:hypothetical protein